MIIKKQHISKQKGGRNLEYQKFIGVILQEVQKAAGEEAKVSVNHILKKQHSLCRRSDNFAKGGECSPGNLASAIFQPVSVRNFH